MARKLNIGYSEIVKTSLMHTTDNGRRFGSFGTLISLRSPLRQPIIREIDPKVATEQNRFSHYLDGSRNPIGRVTLQWRPQTQAAGLSSSRRNKANTISGAQNESAVVTENVDYNIHNEWTEGFDQAQLMKLEPAAESYLNAVNSGLSLNNPNTGANAAMWQGLAEIGERIMEKIETAILEPLNTVCLTNMIAGVGKNLVDGSDGTTIPTIVLYADDDKVKKDFVAYVMNIMRKHQMKTKPIVVGGTLAAQFITEMGWTSLQDIGYDFDRIRAQMPFEFYYDSQIDTTYGDGYILISEPGAAAVNFVPEHEDVIKAKKVSETTFTKGSISLMGFDTELTTVDMDLRIIESDAGAYPQLYVVPSLRAGIFTRPEGAIKTTGGFEDVTGIWAARLVRYASEV